MSTTFQSARGEQARLILQRLLRVVCLLIAGYLSLFPICSIARQQGYPAEGGMAQSGPDSAAWFRYPIEVYANQSSVRQGDPVNFHTAAGYTTRDNAQYRMQFYRIGVTDSLVFTPGSTFTLSYQALHDSLGREIPVGSSANKPRPKEYATGCSQWWPGAYTLPGNVTTGWKSGLYYVKCSLVSDTTIFRRAPFVVKAANPGFTSRILYKVPFSTYHAYSSWGGSCFYWGTNPSFAVNTDTLSFLRPIGGFLDIEPNDIGAFDLAEKYFIAWAEGSGYVMEYCTNLDLDADQSHSFITSYKFLVTAGHDEYWGTDERKDVDINFIQGGGNIAFLSGNVCYWKVSYPNNRTRMQAHKFQSNDSRWRNQPDVPGSGPEAKFLGVQVDDFPTDPSYYYPGKSDTVRLYTHWLFKDTGLHDGNAFGYGHLSDQYGNTFGASGGEIDRKFPGTSPSNIQIISSARFSANIHDLHEAGFYIDTLSNARVFSTGSIYWNRGLYGSIPDDRDKFRTIMTNLMDHFSEKKFVGNIYGTANKWSKNVEIDGNATIVAVAALKLNNMTLTIDSSYTLTVNGTLNLDQSNGSVNIIGKGNVQFSSTATVNITTSSRNGWNLVSVPAVVSDYRKSALYPSASSTHAFAYNGAGYFFQDTLIKGSGYWVKFDAVPTINYSGTPVVAETISVRGGWNMIGSLSLPLPTTKVIQSTGGMVISKYFGYNGSYYQTDTLIPGQAYWVKSNTAGTLILNIASSVNIPPSTATITPPLPPPPSAPTLSSPANGTSGVTLTPTLTWNAVSGATSYRLQVSISSTFSPILDDYLGVTSTSYPPGGLGYSTTYYWRVNASDNFSTGDWSSVWSLTTQASPPPPCECCNQSIVSSDPQMDSPADPCDPYKAAISGGTQFTLPQIPETYSLGQNYPNPFNPTTEITYGLPEDANVLLTVYNVLGQEALTLVNKFEPAGYKTVSFDANTLPSGVYFYRIQAGTFSDSKKMFLMK